MNIHYSVLSKPYLPLKKMHKKHILILFLLLFGFQYAIAQNDSIPTDSLSKFDSFNKKAEALFKVIPVPIISYSQEAGNVLGLAKFNAFHPVKKDTISMPSKISGSVSFSTKGRVNVSLNNDLILKENKYLILTRFNYKKQPEYLFGIGNDVSVDSIEEVITDMIKFNTNAMIRVHNHIYAGIALDFTDYIKVKTDSTSFLIRDMVTGLNGGTDFGLGVSVVFDSRDNRYNAHEGALIKTSLLFYQKSLGSAYQFSRLELDARKYFSPWLKHVIAFQATLTGLAGDVPFYDLAMLGGENKMRGYYKGALRDNVLVDTQAEYRMPVWKIFGLVGWVGTGRVAHNYKDLSLDGFWFSYGGGLRIKVDSENNINLRLDMGFGANGIKGVYFNFAEAF